MAAGIISDAEGPRAVLMMLSWSSVLQCCDFRQSSVNEGVAIRKGHTPLSSVVSTVLGHCEHADWGCEALV